MQRCHIINLFEFETYIILTALEPVLLWLFVISAIVMFRLISVVICASHFMADTTCEFVII